jgi:hypothetical protein
MTGAISSAACARATPVRSSGTTLRAPRQLNRDGAAAVSRTRSCSRSRGATTTNASCVSSRSATTRSNSITSFRWPGRAGHRRQYSVTVPRLQQHEGRFDEGPGLRHVLVHERLQRVGVELTHVRTGPEKLGPDLGPIRPKHQGKSASIGNQKTRPAKKIENRAESAKPPSPVQIRAAPPNLPKKFRD